jgi:hypothetical protein
MAIRTRRQSGHRGIVDDVWRGAVLGDFAPRLGLAGAATQAALGYVPLVGEVCAVRDGIADWRQHDRLGVALNVLALVPVFGGFAKTLDVLHSTHRIGRAIFTDHTRAAA